MTLRGGEMRHRGLLVVVLGVLVVGGGLFAAYHFSLSALNEPGRWETYMATEAKHWLVSRSARGPLPPQPPNNALSLATGQMLFGGECASCHGQDGRTPTDIGRWMYPRTLDLSSQEVQQWSEAELFWIIKNGIRLSGMPAFGKVHSDEQIWHLVHFVRTVGRLPQRSSATAK